MPEKTDLHHRIMNLAQCSLETLVSPTIDRGVEPPVREMVRDMEHAFPDSPARACLIAGLWLLMGDLEKSHVICQEIATLHGSAWHAVVHRMEGDFWNSKYWWRRASRIAWKGLPELFKQQKVVLPAEMKNLTCSPYDPAAFVDVVEAHHRTASPELRQAMVAVQRIEWQTLFGACWNQAS